ncbi:hypothetical protein CCMA1212_009345 [Trichoderma ghanense]|uniref:Rho-GAP domain-containing protein n=1 Tax=Trichoderma ghanense TaxID=65468 RepID=A0ABY2GS77_9HYPO
MEESVSQARSVASSVSLACPPSATVQTLLGSNAHPPSSRTWTPSSGGFKFPRDVDDVEERELFVNYYNRLAAKYGMRPLVVDDSDKSKANGRNGASPERRGWFFRIFRPSSGQSTPGKVTPPSRAAHKRSVSDLGAFMRYKPEAPKALDLADMVRLSGKSLLHLPTEYAPCALNLPTCLRATAHYVAQNAATRGLFRIPGAVKVVNALHDYYCGAREDASDVSGTVHLATLPTHIQYQVQDVASTFKRFLSCLPGGILGSLSLFDAFLAIHSQLKGQPEYPRTKQTRLRARLIALAIGSVQSQFRRELIIAVFGLLSMIGRIGEVSPREDDEGRPLPTHDLMGYNALGIVFGPLLVGDLIDGYTVKETTPDSGPLLVPTSPKKQRCRDRQKSKDAKEPKDSKDPNAAKAAPHDVNKAMVAVEIAEMLIANWRDIVRQMFAVGAHLDQDTASTQAPLASVAVSLTASLAPDSDAIAVDEGSPGPEASSMSLRRGKTRLSRQGSGRQPSASQLSPTLEEGHQGEPDRGRRLFRTTPASLETQQLRAAKGNPTPVSKPLL